VNPHYRIYEPVDGLSNAPIGASTFDNSEFLAIADRFVTFGGAAYNSGRFFEDATRSRRTGPFFWNPERAHPNRVGGTDGSQVNATAFPNVAGGQMWENRNNLETNSMTPGEYLGDRFSGFINGATAYAAEDGKDVLYVSDFDLWKYTIHAVDNAARDTYEKVGDSSDDVSGPGAGAYDPHRRVFVKLFGGTGSFVVWDLNTPGPSNPAHIVKPVDSSGAFDFGDLGNQGIDYDPVRNSFLLWGGNRELWRLTPPVDVVGVWTLERERPSGGQVPARGAIGAFTGVLGKWKYIPGYDVFLGVIDSRSGDVWVYKPANWQPTEDFESDLTPPVVAISKPSQDARTAGLMRVEVNASDDTSVAGVELLADGTLVAGDDAAPYEIDWDTRAFLDGYVSLTARAYDTAGNDALSREVVIRVDNAGRVSDDTTPPRVSLLAPANGSIVNGFVTASAQASDGSMISSLQIRMDGKTLCSGPLAVLSCQWDTNASPPGTHTIQALATDASGNSGFDIVTVSSTRATSLFDSMATSVAVQAVATTLQVLQSGVSNYSGTSDTDLSLSSPSINYGTQDTLLDQNGKYPYDILARFVIFQSEGGPVPDGATIQSAMLGLYKYSYYDHRYRAHRVLKPWKEDEATWNERLRGTRWSLGGARGLGTDIAVTPDGEATVGWEPGWLEVDVTSAVQAMAKGTPNYGWKLVEVDGNSNIKKFYSSEATASLTRRPKLTVSYSSPTTPVCGNRIVEIPETCDDGNTSNGDGCSAVCQTETTPPASGWNRLGGGTFAQHIGDCGGLDGCNANGAINAWSGGAFDTKRDCLILFGGGHYDSFYAGVDRYCLGSQQWETLFPYSIEPRDINRCLPTDANGNPVSRHSYGTLTFIPAAPGRLHDYVFMYGGSMACKAGTFARDTWLFNLTTNRWEGVGDRLPNNPNANVNYCEYDGKTDQVYCVASNSGWFQMHAFDPDTRTWKVVLPPYVDALLIDHATRPVIVDAPGTRLHRRFVLVYDKPFQMLAVNLDAPALEHVTLIGNPAANLTSPSEGIGLTWHSARKKLVAWAGNDDSLSPSSVFEIDPSTLAVAEFRAAGGPTANPNNRGIYGRFAYSPKSNVLFEVHDATQPPFSLGGALPPPPAPTPPPTSPPTPPPNPPPPTLPPDSGGRGAEIICPDGAGGYRAPTTVIPNDPHGDGCLAKPFDVSVFFASKPYDCAHLKPGLFYLGKYPWKDGGTITGRRCVDVTTPAGFKSTQNFGPREQMVAIIHNDVNITDPATVPFFASKGEMLVIGIPNAKGKPPTITHDTIGSIFSWRPTSGNIAILNLINPGEIGAGSAQNNHRTTITLSGITHRGTGRLILTNFEGGNNPNDPTLPIDDEVYFKNVLVAKSVNSHNVYLDRNGLHYIEGLISYGSVNDGNHALKLDGRMVFLYGSWLSSAGVHGNLPTDNSGQSPLSSVACQVGVIRGNKFLDAVGASGGTAAATAQIRVAINGCDEPQGFLSNTYPTVPYFGAVTYKGMSYSKTPFWDPLWWSGIGANGTVPPALYKNRDMLVTYYLDNTFEVLINGTKDPKNYFGLGAQPTFPTTYPSTAQSDTPRLTNQAPPAGWLERARLVVANNCFRGGNPGKVLNHWPPRMACNDREAPAWVKSWPECTDGQGFPDETDKFVMVGKNECGVSDQLPNEVRLSIEALEKFPNLPWRSW
jgi:cysteine-rich repeat protein